MFGVVALNLCESWFPSRVLDFYLLWKSKLNLATPIFKMATDDLSYKYDKTEYTITAGPLHSKNKIWYHARR